MAGTDDQYGAGRFLSQGGMFGAPKEGLLGASLMPWDYQVPTFQSSPAPLLPAAPAAQPQSSSLFAGDPHQAGMSRRDYRMKYGMIEGDRLYQSRPGAR